MVENFNARRANISVLVGALVLTIGTVIVGIDATDAARQAVVGLAFAAAFSTLLWCYRREDRARARTERDSSSTRRPR
jgi:uncharacterized BrkB/YihY/UPF0761 family membrane protein